MKPGGPASGFAARRKEEENMNTQIVVALAFFCSALSGGAGYAPDKWNIEAREKFAAQCFGIFIHWGIYANYAQGEWCQQEIGIDTETYGRMKDGFCPSEFDAREWVRVFKDAGAKYVTIPKDAGGFPVVAAEQDVER